MSFLKKLFGKKSPEPPAASAPTSRDPAKDPNLIRVHDAYGRELFITKQQWRDSVLLGHLQKVWNQPDELYHVIVQSLQDGFGSDMVEPAEQLARIDPNHERGAVVLAIVYREQKRPDDAERVLRRQIATHGESGVVLTNLAKIQSDRGQSDEALKTLWHGLELDPNQDNGLGWYTAIFKERDGEAGFLEALRRLAALPGSWRAQLWLARDSLQRRALEPALRFYDEALARAPRPVPTDLLQQVSGDLGKHGHLPEILQRVAPHFQIEVHGLAVGNNLLKANLDLGRLDAVQALLDQHYAQKRPDWRETLSFWDNELAKARVAVASAPAQPQAGMLSIEGPVWLAAESPAAALFAPPPAPALRIAFLGSSFGPVDAAQPVHQLSNDPGRFSRALPLFLAEQAQLHGDAAVRTLVPWMGGDAPSFVVCGVPLEDAQAAAHARAGDAPADYVVTTHLGTAGETWRIELRLVRTIDARCLGELACGMSKADVGREILPLASRLVDLLVEQAELKRRPPPSDYQLPGGQDFAHYLVRLEQLLAARCAAIDGVPAGFLYGVRDILDANLQLCLRQPGNVAVRLVLYETLRRLRPPHPQAVDEFRDRVQLLHREHPLSPAVQERLGQVLAAAYP